MLGNSFTFAHDMPDMLSQLLDAEVVQHTRGGAHLAEHLHPETDLGAKTQAALRSKRWDYVVLQEYSTGPITSPERFLDSVRELCRQIRTNGAVPILYATWAFQKDGKKLAESGLDHEAMYRGLYEAYHRAAEENDALIADVGRAFYEQEEQRALFASDDYHPSREGAQLAAQIIADQILAAEAAGDPYIPQGRFVAEDDNRIRILYLYELLRRYTDEDHPMSGPEIRRRIKERFGSDIHRTTVPRDISVLRSAGIEVMQTRTRSVNYYLGERTFSMPELRILIDAVMAFRSITESKSMALAEKLISLTSETNAEKLHRPVYVTGRAGSGNEKGCAIVDIIHDAIRSRRKISFTCFDHDNKKHRAPENDGQPCTVSPYDLIWDGDRCCMTGFCDERGEMRAFRVDRIAELPRILQEEARPAPRGYSVKKYTHEAFRMDAAQKPVQVTLVCEQPVMDDVIDRFGPHVRTKAMENSRFRATVRVCTGPAFYRWVFGWGGMLTIEGPEETAAEYRRMLKEEWDRYRTRK